MLAAHVAPTHTANRVDAEAVSRLLSKQATTEVDGTCR